MHTIPCISDCDEHRFEPELEDQFTDGPELEAPVWLKSEQCISAVEKSAKVDAAGLCRIWSHWRESGDLQILLHGFLMITGLRIFDAAWNEINFLTDVLEAEEKAAVEEAAAKAALEAIK